MTAVREERRLVTCMFIDVVGSTELTMRLGAERLKRELGNAFAEISAIVRAYGGTVEKYIGDAIYALFGAPIAHEDDPLRALRAAEALRDWCLAGAAHGHPFAIRIGIETGEAVVDLHAAETTKQQMSVGPVVNIAARLQQRAEPGEILIGPTVRAATDGATELEALMETDLKGIGRMPAWRLVRVGTAARPSLPFVGREAEMGLLSLAFDRACKGRSVLAVVSGPPGQGKTRLVQEFLRSRDEEIHLTPTRCRPAEETGVFAPVREILGVTTLDELAERIGRMCRDEVECERVVAGLAESAGIATSRSLASLPAAEREDEIVQAWRRYVAMLGTDRLVVLAVDDIHWADPSLVRLVDRLTFGGPRVLVIATARPEFANAAGIRPSGDRFFVELEGLEREDAERLAQEAGAADARVIERAEGNPLFLVELARAGTDVADLPLTLQGALGARLDQLPAPDRVLLSLAAVAGERFTTADAAVLAERDRLETGRTLARLADLHFLDLTDTGFRFHHGLVRDVAYGRLLSAERMKAHARFARDRVHPEDAETLAHHWWEALRPPDAEWVWQDDPDVPAMRREAFRAHLVSGIRHGEHFATDLAVEILGRALTFAHDDGERAAAERALGRTYLRILRQDEAWEHLTRALALQQRDGRAPLEAYLDLVEAAQWTGAFRRVPAEGEVTLLANAGVAAARAAGDQAAIARILRAHAAFLTNKDELDERADGLIEDAVVAADASGDAEVRRRVLLTRSMILLRQGRPMSSREFGALEPSGDALERMNFLRMLANRHFGEADLEASARSVREARELAEPMGPHNRTHAYGIATQVHKARADWPEVIALAQITARLVKENPSSAFCNVAATVMRDGAIAHALAGRREEALALLQAMPTNDIEVDIVEMVPRALLGFPSPKSDARLHARRWGWWEWEQAATRALLLRRPDAAEAALREMGPIVDHAVAQRAFAHDVREAIRELRGGPAATYDALRKIGFTGWVEILKRQVDAEY